MDDFAAVFVLDVQQESQEPICIDSDDDAHPNGAAPARGDGQSGAALAVRHSERIRENQATKTTQLFKVPFSKLAYTLGVNSK